MLAKPAFTKPSQLNFRSRCDGERYASGLRPKRLSHFQSDALFAAIRDVRHVRGNRRAVANLNRRIRDLTGTHAIDPIGHMILIRSLSGKCSPFTPVGLLRKITNVLSRPSGRHVGYPGYMFDGAVASEQALAQAVTAVAESGLPGDNCVRGIFERNYNRVRHFASVFLGEHAPDINAALGSGRSRAVIIQAIWCTMFSVTFPPENSQYNLQLINLKGSNSRSGRPFRKAFQLTFCAVQFEGTLRTH